MTVKIGKEEKAFVLSRELLCRQSAYFEKAFGASSSFKESKSRICVLSDIPVGIFRIFSAWVYGSGLCYIGENNGNAMKDDDFEMFAGQASEIRGKHSLRTAATDHMLTLPFVSLRKTTSP